MCKVSENREQNKINLFIFSAEVHPNFFSRRLEKLVQVERRAKIKTQKKHFYCLSYSWNMSAGDAFSDKQRSNTTQPS